jgi:hypothetical protein
MSPIYGAPPFCHWTSLPSLRVPIDRGEAISVDKAQEGKINLTPYNEGETAGKSWKIRKLIDNSLDSAVIIPQGNSRISPTSRSAVECEYQGIIIVLIIFSPSCIHI